MDFLLPALFLILGQGGIDSIVEFLTGILKLLTGGS